MVSHEQLFFNTSLNWRLLEPCAQFLVVWDMCVIHNPQNIHVCYNWYPRPILNLKKSTSGIITWIDFIWNWLHSWKYHRLAFCTGILSFTQSVNIPLPTKNFHSTSYAATLPPVLISYNCKYIWTWFKHMFWKKIQEDMYNCNIWCTSWKIRVVWLIFINPYPKIGQFLAVQYMQFYYWNLKT